MVQFLRLFANPLVAILLVASVVSAILGDRINASIIIVIVLLSNILNFVQTYRSQQAALTGESLPTEKSADDGGDATESFADAHNCVFLGTSVVSGLGTALITATGRNTAFGDIAVRLASRAPETEFERGLKGFGMLIM